MEAQAAPGARRSADLRAQKNAQRLRGGTSARVLFAASARLFWIKVGSFKRWNQAA